MIQKESISKQARSLGTWEATDAHPTMISDLEDERGVKRACPFTWISEHLTLPWLPLAGRGLRSDILECCLLSLHQIVLNKVLFLGNN